MNIMHKDLHLKHYKIQNHQLLKEFDCSRRLQLAYNMRPQIDKH